MEQNSAFIFSNQQKIIQIIDENLDDDDDDLISIRVEDSDEEDDEEEEDDGNYKLNISYERNLENIDDNDSQDTVLYDPASELGRKPEATAIDDDAELLNETQEFRKDIPVGDGIIKIEEDGIKREIDINAISDHEDSVDLDFEGFENNDYDYQKTLLSPYLVFDTRNIKQEEPLIIDDVFFDDETNSQSTKNPLDIFDSPSGSPKQPVTQIEPPSKPIVAVEVSPIVQPKSPEPIISTPAEEKNEEKFVPPAVDKEESTIDNIPLEEEFCEISSILNEHSYLSQEQVNNIINYNNNSKNNNSSSNVSVDNSNDSLTINNLLNLINKKLSCNNDLCTSTKTTETINAEENVSNSVEISVNVISKLIESLACKNNNNVSEKNDNSTVIDSSNNSYINNFIKDIEENLNLIKKSYRIIEECDKVIVENGAPCVSNDSTVCVNNTTVLNNVTSVVDNYKNTVEAETNPKKLDLDKSNDFDEDANIVLRIDEDSTTSEKEHQEKDIMAKAQENNECAKTIENEDIHVMVPVVEQNGSTIEESKTTEEQIEKDIQTVEPSIEQYRDFEMLGKKVLGKRAQWMEAIKDADNSENIKKEIATFITEIRNDLISISRTHEISKEFQCEQMTQTDEKVSIESAKKLNESYKRRHLASSSSDVSSDLLDSDDDFFVSKRRRKRIKKHTKRIIQSDTDDDVDNQKASVVVADVEQANSEGLISVQQEDTEMIKKDVDMSQIELDISEYLVRKPVDSTTSKTEEVELIKGTDKSVVNDPSIFEETTQQYPIKENGHDESDTQIIESDNESDDTNIFNQPTQIFNEKVNKNQKEDDEDDLLDKEIDRATNFASLDKKRPPVERQKSDGVIQKKKKKQDIIDIIKEAEKKDESDSSSDDNEEAITDEQYLRNKNLETKWSLLNSSDSSDDSINSDDMEDIENYMKVSSDEKSSDESSDVDKFLETMNNKTIENEINKSIAQVEGESSSKKNVTVDPPPAEIKNKTIENETNTKKSNETVEINNGNELEPLDKDNDESHNSQDLDMEAFENFWKEHSNNHDEILDQAIASDMNVVEDVENANAASETAKKVSKATVVEEESTDKDDLDANLLNCEVILTEGQDNETKYNAESTSKQTQPKMKRDNIDKELFSKNLLASDNDDSEAEEVKPAPFEVMSAKKKSAIEKDDTKSEATSNTGDSDCEILDISMFQAKRKTKPVDIETMLKTSVKKNNAGASATSSKSTVSINDNSKGDEDCIYLSSDSDSSDLEEVVRDEEENENDESNTTRKKPRAILTDDQLTVETKQAQKEESDRIKRLEKKHEMMSQRLSQLSQSQTEGGAIESEIILDYDTKRKQNICVHPEIVKHLKPHQIDGVKFMYDSCYGSVDNIDKYPGSGCILAHCMGLGKTLQLIAVLHTLIRYSQLKTHRILVICPKSTVMNWSEEIQRWLGPIKSGPKLKVFHFPDNSDINDKMKILKEWHKCGTSGHTKSGCLLVGYEAFRTLVFYHLSKKKSINMGSSEIESIKKTVNETLLNPGADLIICDEGHVIKNKKSATNVAVSQVKTKRRVILTGTPIQNNLKEYYCMVNFIKPSFLGTEKEFANLYANPIRSGQHKDSSKSEIKFMKQRSFVLHKKLSKFVQRREAAVLKSFLPDKFEYVLFIPMTRIQETLYEYFLENNSLKEKYGGKSLIPDYTFLRKIWTHPKVLENAWQNAVTKREKEKIRIRKIMNESDDDRPDDELDSQVGKMSVLSDWWRPHLMQQDLESLFSSNKLRVMFEILKLCEENGEKCLIFSAFVAVLNAVEFFMEKIHNRDEATCHQLGLTRFRGPWVLGQDYYRLDGKTPKTVRHAMITKFNSPDNRRTKCFLISAKAGGQGINLTGANRVIILDTSWNPSNDQQNIFRIFRLGQKRSCYVYRILAMGTMEEKVYSRSVTKQAMSFRVVDEQQIDRHYSMAELAELYTLTKTDYTQRPVPIRPADNLLSSLLHHFPDLVYKYHEHDSLLENKPEQDLSEADKAEAWAAYEKDVQRTAMLDPLNELNMLNAQQNYRIGAGMQYPYGYGKGMNFGMVNNPNYANTLGSNYLSSFLNPYQSILSSISADPNLMRMRQMYSQHTGTNYPYGNLNSPTGGQNSGIVDTYGATGGPALFGGNLINQSPYFKSLTPPIPPPPSTIRPMAGGFNSLDDMANFLAVPSSNTPPPPAHSSSTSVPVSSPLATSQLFKDLDTSLFKQYYANPNLFNSTIGSIAPSMSIQNSTTLPPVVSSVMSTATSTLTNQTVTTKTLNSIQPSIPTSVITKPIGRPPIVKEVSLPNINSLTAANPASSLNTNVVGRYSPQPHVIVKSKTQTPTTSVSSLASPTATITTNPSTINAAINAATLVKNYNMGIVYPKENAPKNNAASSVSIVTKPGNSTIVPAIKPHVIRKTNAPSTPIKTSVSTPNLTKAITSTVPSSMALAKSNTNTASATGATKKSDQLVNMYMKKLHMMTSHLSTSTTTTLSAANRSTVSNNTTINLPESSNKAKSSNTNTYQLSGININELAKSSGLSITPVNATKTTPTATVQQTQNANFNKLPKGVTVKTLKLQKSNVPTPPQQIINANKLSSVTPIPSQNIATTATAVGNKTVRRSAGVPQTINNNNTTIISVPQQTVPVQSVGPNTIMVPQPKINVSNNGSNNAINSNNVRYVGLTPTTTNANNMNNTKFVSVQGGAQQVGAKSVPPLVLSRNTNNGSNVMKPIRLTETYAKKKADGSSLTTTTVPTIVPKHLVGNQTVVRTLPQQTAYKRKATDTLTQQLGSAGGSSLTITESKKKALIDSSVKKMKAFDGLTIIPKNVQHTMQQNLRGKQKDNIVDIVELE